MEYAKLVNAIGAYMQTEARTFTRYNKKTNIGEGDEAHLSARDTKFVVVDYKDTDVSFYLRAGQVRINDKGADIDEMIAKFKEDDATLTTRDTIEEAIKYSIGEKYLPVANDVVKMAKAFIDENNHHCHLKFANFFNGEGSPLAAIFVQCSDQTMAITLAE